MKMLLPLLLPLFLFVGCVYKKSVAETKPELDGVNRDKIEYRLDDLYYLKGSDAPYTGKVFEEWSGQQRVETNYIDGKLDGLSESWHENGKKASKVNYKEGKQDGLSVGFHENGQKWREVNWEDGELVKGSEKFWNSKGDPVDSMKESFKK
tara:strand:+ start:93 stop:545 length:453 start_codon:yes stop_codon:yes gene_type:complete